MRCTQTETPQVVNVIRELAAIDRLRELSRCDQPAIVQSAGACLHNLFESISAVSKTLAITKFVMVEMGPEYVSPPVMDFNNIYQDSTPLVPVIFVLR